MTSFSTTVSGAGRFYVRVRASNGSNTTDPSNEIFVTLGPALPGAPSGLVPLAQRSTVTLTWNPPADGGSPSNCIIKVTSPPSNFGTEELANFNTGTSETTFTGGGVPVGTYYVTIQGSNSSGAGAPSDLAIASVTGRCDAPSAPGARRGDERLRVTLTLTAGVGAASYQIHVGSASGRSDVLVSDLGSSATSLRAANVAPGTYFVHLQSLNASEASGSSNEISVIVR